MTFASAARNRLSLGATVLVFAIAAGFGYAQRSSAAVTSTGVVNITTNLAYQNGAAAGTGMVITGSGLQPHLERDCRRLKRHERRRGAPARERP
jgi:hypothetical protein